MKIYYYEGKANIIGPNIKKERIKLHLSQDALAAKLQLKNIEMSQKIVSRIEKQERFVTDYELLAFSEVLKVDIYELLGVKNSSN